MRLSGTGISLTIGRSWENFMGSEADEWEEIWDGVIRFPKQPKCAARDWIGSKLDALEKHRPTLLQHIHDVRSSSQAKGELNEEKCWREIESTALHHFQRQLQRRGIVPANLTAREFLALAKSLRTARESFEKKDYSGLYDIWWLHA